MKKIALIIFAFLLFIGACLFVDINVHHLLLNASGRNYIFQNHIFYNRILYLDDSGATSIPDIAIRWDRVLGVIIFASIGIYTFIKRR